MVFFSFDIEKSPAFWVVEKNSFIYKRILMENVVDILEIANNFVL